MAFVLMALGIASAVYGVSVMLVGSGTWFFLFWFVLGGLLAGAGWGVRAGLWAAFTPAVQGAFLAVLGVVLLGFAAMAALVMGDFDDAGEENLDYLVVLGAQVHEWGPSAVLQYRLDVAADYLKRNPQTKCIVSGGQGANEPAPEADVMAEYLCARGIDRSRIACERESLNTNQNIAYSRKLFNAQTDTVGIVTNNFHVFRACKIAAKQGIAHASGIAAPTTLWYVPNNVVRETIGIAKDFLVGNL